MKFNFDKYPLCIYNEPASKSLLESLNIEVALPELKHLNPGEVVFTNLIKKATGVGSLPFIFEKIVAWVASEKMHEGLSDLINKQRDRIKQNPSSFVSEAQLNLMATSCITDYIASYEAGSCGKAVENMLKMCKKVFTLKNPLEVLWESAEEVTIKYEGIGQLYHIAFLLIAYNSVPHIRHIVKSLIAESWYDDVEGCGSFSAKGRPVLFANVQYKSVEENLRNRIGVLSLCDFLDKDVFEPAIKKRKELNAELSEQA